MKQCLGRQVYTHVFLYISRSYHYIGTMEKGPEMVMELNPPNMTPRNLKGKFYCKLENHWDPLGPFEINSVLFSFNFISYNGFSTKHEERSAGPILLCVKEFLYIKLL